MKNKESKSNVNSEKDKYIKSLENKIMEYEQEIDIYKEKMMKLEVKNKMNLDNRSKNEEQLVNYQQIIDNERNKVKNADSIISRLRAELDYVKEKSVIENKVIKDEIINLKKKIIELNEKLNNIDNSESEGNNENIPKEDDNIYDKNSNININNNSNKKTNSINKKNGNMNKKK